MKVEFELDTQAGCRDSVEREDETRLKLESRVTNDLDEFDRRLDLYSSEEEEAYQLRLRRCHVNLLRKHQLRASHASFAAQMVDSPGRTYRCSMAKEMCQSQSVVSCYLSPSAHE